MRCTISARAESRAAPSPAGNGWLRGPVARRRSAGTCHRKDQASAEVSSVVSEVPGQRCDRQGAREALMQPEQQLHGDCGQAKGAEIDRRSVRQQDPREAGVHPSHLREHHMRGKPDGKVGHHADHRRVDERQRGAGTNSCASGPDSNMQKFSAPRTAKLVNQHALHQRDLPCRSAERKPADAPSHPRVQAGHPRIL